MYLRNPSIIKTSPPNTHINIIALTCFTTYLVNLYARLKKYFIFESSLIQLIILDNATTTEAPRLNLKTYPNEQTIKESKYLTTEYVNKNYGDGFNFNINIKLIFLF